jgi:hypothetical protein
MKTKNKIPHLILAGLLGTTLASQGVSVLVSNADYDTISQTGSSDLGTLVTTDGIVSFDTSPATLTYNVSGLDINGFGGNNDSVDITMSVTTKSGGTIWTNAPSTFIGDSSAIQNSTEGLRWDFDSMSVNIDGGTGNGISSFDGFTAITLGQWSFGTDTAIVNGTSYSAAAASVSFTAADSIVVDWGAGNFRLGTIDFGFTAAVPEPSSTALLGLGGLALMLRRKRS